MTSTKTLSLSQPQNITADETYMLFKNRAIAAHRYNMNNVTITTQIQNITEVGVKLFFS